MIIGVPITFHHHHTLHAELMWGTYMLSVPMDTIVSYTVMNSYPYPSNVFPPTLLQNMWLLTRPVSSTPSTPSFLIYHSAQFFGELVQHLQNASHVRHGNGHDLVYYCDTNESFLEFLWCDDNFRTLHGVWTS
jgi:hypothetical protein